MPHLRNLRVVLLAMALAGAPGMMRGQTASPESLQAQVDALRRGQEQLQRDMGELKALLLQMRGGRAETGASQAPQVASVNVHGEPFKGSPKARVAILEYSDFDCTYCARYARTVLPLIERDYIQAGTVKYFFRDLPLEKEHPNAVYKARVARCAGDQGKFWEAHDHLFNDQRPFDTPRLKAFASDLGMDWTPFNACLESDRYLDPIHRSLAMAQQYQIPGTPAFIFGILSEDGSVLRVSKVMMGGQSFEAFKGVLDALLKSAPK